MEYALQRSVTYAEGSRNALIAVAASLARLQESTIRDHCMDLVKPLATLSLWQGLQHRDERLSTIWMDLGDIQRGQWGRFRVGGDWLQGLEGLELGVYPAEFRGRGGILRRNDLLP